MREDSAVEYRIEHAEFHGDADRPLVLLLHGWGSNERDMVSLAPHLPGEFSYASLRGPLPAPPGFGWFRLQFVGTDIRVHDVQIGAEAIAEWCSLNDVNPVGAVGFSQGGATALQLMRAGQPNSLAWAAVLGGFVIGPVSGAAADPRDATLAETRPHVFWGRGLEDTVISQSRVDELDSWLDTHADATKRSYPGLTHAVSADEIADLSEWMRQRAATTQ